MSKTKEKLEYDGENGTDMVNGYDLNIYQKSVIDEYFDNGFNAYRAAKTVNPKLTDGTAKLQGHLILKEPKNQAYIRAKQREMQLSNGITQSEVINELKGLAYADATDYIGLTVQELKELPPAVRRCLNNIQITRRTYTNKDGNEVTDEQIKVSLVDKIKAFDMIAKNVGLYEANNNQKANRIDLSKYTPEQLNTLLKASEMINNQKKLG